MDTPLKQRLIGAAVLIALAVFFLPMLVKGPAPDSGVSNVSTDIPDGPEGASQTRDLPLAAPGDVPQGGAVGMDATPVDRPATDASASTPPAGDSATATDPAVASTDPAAATDATAAVGLPPAVAGGNYAVHFGAYATQKAADTVAALAKKSQLPAYSEPATVGGKAAWRVRIGPFATRADAESARLKALEVRSDVPVRVVVLDAESAPATPAAAEPTPAPAVEAPKPVAAKPSEPTEPKPAELKPVAPKPAAPKPVAPKPTMVAKPTPAKPVETAPKPVAAKPVQSKPVETKPASAKPTPASTSAAPATAAAKPVAPKPADPKPVATAPKPAVAKPSTPADSGALVAVAPKPKPTAAAKVGFAVQLGAFSAAADANALRDRLRASGFAAFTETVSTDKGSLTRVRVGPVVDRAAADQLKAQVQAKTGVEGIVRPHP